MHVHAERAGSCIKQACEGGALRFMHTGLLRSVPFEDNLPAQRELYAQAIHQLLMTFLDAEPGRCLVLVLLTVRSTWCCLFDA